MGTKRQKRVIKTLVGVGHFGASIATGDIVGICAPVLEGCWWVCREAWRGSHKKEAKEFPPEQKGNRISPTSSRFFKEHAARSTFRRRSHHRGCR